MIPWYIEILNIIITIVVVGYVFSGIIKFQRLQTGDSIFDKYKIFDWEEFKWGIMIAAPELFCMKWAISL